MRNDQCVTVSLNSVQSYSVRVVFLATWSSGLRETYLNLIKFTVSPVIIEVTVYLAY